MNKQDYILINALFYDAPKLQTASCQFGISVAGGESQLKLFLDTRKITDKTKEMYLYRFKNSEPERVELELEKKNIEIVTIKDLNYPKLLKDTVDPPVILFAKGNVELINQNPCMAVVGTRNMTSYGREVTQSLVGNLQTFFTIVSGMAAGVDTVAHRTTLEEEGATIAVVGTPLDQCYPKSNEKMMSDIINKGVVLSEYPLGVRSQSYYFPMRNRIVSGMSVGVFVSEAGEKSGSLITARLSMELGRDVFCVPGSILIKHNKGNHSLIQDGAKLVTTLEDILVEFPSLLPQFSLGKLVERVESVLPPLTGEATQLYSCITEEDTEMDQIIANSGMSVQKVMQYLMQFELEARVIKTGTCYRRSV